MAAASNAPLATVELWSGDERIVVSMPMPPLTATDALVDMARQQADLRPDDFSRGSVVVR
jgi:hypothetical protein